MEYGGIDLNVQKIDYKIHHACTWSKHNVFRHCLVS